MSQVHTPIRQSAVHVWTAATWRRFEARDPARARLGRGWLSPFDILRSVVRHPRPPAHPPSATRGPNSDSDRARSEACPTQTCRVLPVRDVVPRGTHVHLHRTYRPQTQSRGNPREGPAARISLPRGTRGDGENGRSVCLGRKAERAPADSRSAAHATTPRTRRNQRPFSPRNARRRIQRTFTPSIATITPLPPLPRPITHYRA